MDRRVSIFKQNKHAGKLNIVMAFMVIVYRFQYHYLKYCLFLTWDGYLQAHGPRDGRLSVSAEDTRLVMILKGASSGVGIDDVVEDLHRQSWQLVDGDQDLNLTKTKSYDTNSRRVLYKLSLSNTSTSEKS